MTWRPVKNRSLSSLSEKQEAMWNCVSSLHPLLSEVRPKGRGINRHMVSLCKWEKGHLFGMVTPPGQSLKRQTQMCAAEGTVPADT
mgnify:CR=1 FL=1